MTSIKFLILRDSTIMVFKGFAGNKFDGNYVAMELNAYHHMSGMLEIKKESVVTIITEDFESNDNKLVLDVAQIKEVLVTKYPQYFI